MGIYEEATHHIREMSGSKLTSTVEIFYIIPVYDLLYASCGSMLSQ